MTACGCLGRLAECGLVHPRHVPSLPTISSVGTLERYWRHELLGAIEMNDLQWMTSFDAIFLRDHLLIHLHVNTEWVVMILRGLSSIVGICGLCLHTAYYRHKAYQYQINIAALQCGVVKLHMIETFNSVSHFPNLIQSSMRCREIVLRCYAARLWPSLFWLAVPWKTAAISGGMPLAKHHSKRLTRRELEWWTNLHLHTITIMIDTVWWIKIYS